MTRVIGFVLSGTAEGGALPRITMARARRPRDSRRDAGATLVFPQAVNSCPSRAYRPERSPEPRLKPVQVSCCRGASEDARFPQKSSHQRLDLTMNSRF